MSAVLASDHGTDGALPEVPFEPGIRTDLSNEDYHRIDALSASGLKRILQSPMHYRWDRDNPREPTDSMQLGTAVHLGVLEPDKFATDCIAVPEDAPKKPTLVQLAAAKPSPAAMESIAWWDAFAKRAAGKLVLSADTYAKALSMIRAVKAHPAVEWLMSEGAPEVSFQWSDAHWNVPCKCRFDWLRPDGIAMDLKTTVDASPEEFPRAVASFKYHLQNRWYDIGHEHLRDESLRGFAFVAVENVAPYGVAVYTIEPNALAFANGRIEEALMRYKNARDSGFWKGYSGKINPLTLPRWATTVTPTY